MGIVHLPGNILESSIQVLVNTEWNVLCFVNLEEMVICLRNVNGIKSQGL